MKKSRRYYLDCNSSDPHSCEGCPHWNGRQCLDILTPEGHTENIKQATLV